MPSQHTRRTAGWKRVRLAILERDQHTCAYCGGEATEVDHILAVANGGSDEPSNLVAACKPCNGKKSDRHYTRRQYVNPEWF